MTNAIIYTRVSTDEQADKGYSLRYQEERLRQYCSLQKINVIQHFKDDYSAKTFERPAFKQLKEYVIVNRKHIDCILFVKWDRFSRNTSDSYNMIKYFFKLGITVQAIEQPIDVKIPEQKILLAFYLAYPEIENDRRALNTRQGMIKAMKEGRWVSNAPLGYQNGRDIENKPILIPNEKAVLINEMFEKLAGGCYNQEEIRREYNSKGLKISKSHISRIFLNPAYIGKIKVPSFNTDPEMIIEGLHVPIVKEEIFYRVQDILNSSNKKGKPSKLVNPNLPLRHHLKCPDCGRNLTGSASKGNGGRYYYYHCQRGCNTRYKADIANSDFTQYLHNIKIKPEIIKLYKEIVKDVFTENSKEHDKRLVQIEKDMAVNSDKISRVDNLLIEGKIDDSTHKRMTIDVNNKIKNLYAEKMNYGLFETDYQKYLNYGFNILENLDGYYSEADIHIKGKLISSIFPDRLIYQNGNYRTNGTNNIISLLSGEIAENEGIKKGNIGVKHQHSPDGSAYGDRTRTLRLERAAC